MQHYYSEIDLANGCKQRDPRAQRALYQRYYRKMYAVCLRYTDSKEDAEDIFQEAFVKVFKGITAFRGVGSLEGWVRKIFIRTSIEYYRKRSRSVFNVNIEEAYDIGTKENLHSNINREEILKAIRELPTGYRTIFNLYAIEGYSHKEIAQMLGISEGTSKSQLFRAKKLLQGYLSRLNEWSTLKGLAY